MCLIISAWRMLYFVFFTVKCFAVLPFSCTADCQPSAQTLALISNCRFLRGKLYMTPGISRLFPVFQVFLVQCEKKVSPEHVQMKEWIVGGE